MVVLVIWLRFWLVCGVWVCSLQLAVGGLGLRFLIGLPFGCAVSDWWLHDCDFGCLVVLDVYFMVGCWCVCVLLGLL